MPSRISLEEVRRQEPTGSLRQTTDGVLIELLGHAEFRKARSRVGRGRESPDSVDVGAGRPAVVGKKRMSVELGALGGVLPVEEPARQKVVPVFARGIEKIEPDVAPRGRVGLDDRQHDGRHDERHEHVQRIGKRHGEVVLELHALRAAARGEAAEHVGEALEEAASAPGRAARELAPEVALPCKVGMALKHLLLCRACVRVVEHLGMHAQPVEDPVETIGRIDDEHLGDAPRQMPDVLVAPALEIVAQALATRALAEAPRPRAAQQVPDHPVGLVADDVGHGLLGEEAHPGGELHEVDARADAVAVGNGAAEVLLNRVVGRDDGHFLEGALEKTGAARPACGDAERLDVVHEADAQDLVAVAVDGVDHVWRIA